MSVCLPFKAEYRRILIHTKIINLYELLCLLLDKWTYVTGFSISTMNLDLIINDVNATHLECITFQDNFALNHLHLHFTGSFTSTPSTTHYETSHFSCSCKNMALFHQSVVSILKYFSTTYIICTTISVDLFRVYPF